MSSDVILILTDIKRRAGSLATAELLVQIIQSIAHLPLCELKFQASGGGGFAPLNPPRALPLDPAVPSYRLAMSSAVPLFE